MNLKQARYYLEYLAAVSAIKIISHCPRKLFFLLAPAVGRILYLFPQMGKVSVQNLAVAFPEKSAAEHRRIAVKCLENLFLTLADFFWSKGKTGIVEKLVYSPPETEHVFDLAHQHEKDGIIFITPHHGNWEFGGMTLSLIYHFKVGTVVRSPRNPYLDRLISSGRMVPGVRIIYSHGAARGMKHALDDGYTIGTLIDQNTRVRNGGIFVNFFGLPVPVSRAPAEMARKHGYFIVTGTVVRNGDDFSCLVRTLPKPVSEYSSDEELTQDLMSIAEAFIRQYPEQYLWMYKRFQYIPRDADETLKKRYPSYASVAGDEFYDVRTYINGKSAKQQSR